MDEIELHILMVGIADTIFIAVMALQLVKLLLMREIHYMNGHLKDKNLLQKITML